MPGFSLSGLDHDALIALGFLVSILALSGGVFIWLFRNIMSKPRPRS